MTVLKSTTDIFIKRHWKDNEDYEFVKKSVETLIDGYKNKIMKGEFTDKSQLFTSCQVFLNGFLDTINGHTDKNEQVKLYNCFAFSLINELLEDF